MVHLRNRYCKTYVPVPGFSERQKPVLPQYTIGGTGRSSRGHTTKPGEPPRRPVPVVRPPTGVNAYQPSYFSISRMRNKSAPPADFSRQAFFNHNVRAASSSSTSSARNRSRKSGGHSVLPTVTGTSITAPPSPRSEYYSALERGQLMNEDLEVTECVSLLGSVDNALIDEAAPHGTNHPNLPWGDNQSVTTLDGQSVVTDQTVDDRNLVPFLVTFTKAKDRIESNNSKRATSPKSVRFSLPDKCETESQSAGGGGIAFSSRSSDISHSGSSVVDGFYVQSTSNHATSWLNNSENHRPVPSLSVINSISTDPDSSNATPTAIMRSRGALSNSKQVPGRYFPPLALSDELSRSSPSPFPNGTSGRVGSGNSTFSAPSALGAANITTLQKVHNIPNFAVTSSRSWTTGGDQANNANNKNKVPLKTKTFSLASPGRSLLDMKSPRPINQDSHRDTMYNRKKQSFWEMYDANPHKFTINLSDECPSYDPLSVLHSDYYSVRRTPEPVKLTRSSSVKRTSSSSFHGCLEGSAKTLHTKKTPSQSFET